MAEELLVPLSMLAKLPPKTLRHLAGVAEQERGPRPEPPSLEDCVKVILRQHKLSETAPAENGQKQLDWRRAYVAAVGDCHRRRTTGQQRAVVPGIPGALVATTKAGMPRMSPAARGAPRRR